MVLAKKGNIENLKNESTDSYSLVYYLFFLLGLVHILPWTFFLNANSYWMYKFRDVFSSNTTLKEKTDLQVDFSPGITLSLQITTIIFYLLGLFHGHKFTIAFKLRGTLCVVLTLFVATTIFIFIDTDRWQTLFFVITMLTVVVISAMNAIYGLTVLGVIANFPTIYLGSYLRGMGVASIFTALLQIFALAIGFSITASALVYFWTATGVIAIVLCSMTLIIKKNAFYQFHLKNKTKVEKKEMMSYQRIVYLAKKIWPGGALMFTWIAAETTVHPCITTLIVSEGAGTSEWNDKYFHPVITFFMLAVFDYAGRIAAENIKIKIKPSYQVAFGALRIFVFVPLLMLCNAYPRNHLPVVFPHDYQYITILAFFAVTGGYVSYMIYYIIPQLVPIDDVQEALQLNSVIVSILLGLLSFIPFVSVYVI